MHELFLKSIASMDVMWCQCQYGTHMWGMACTSYGRVATKMWAVSRLPFQCLAIFGTSRLRVMVTGVVILIIFSNFSLICFQFDYWLGYFGLHVSLVGNGELKLMLTI